MKLQHLRLYQFRNIEHLDIEFSTGVNFILGQNGQGKTNLLESIYFLSTGRSFRTSKMSDLVEWKKGDNSVFGRISTSDDEFELGISVEKNKKQAYYNGNKLPLLSDFIGKFLCVGFSPNDLEIVQGAPATRRALIDRHLSEVDKAYFEDLMSYHKALKSKNIVLKQEGVRAEAVETWNELLAPLAVNITEKREAFVKSLSSKANEYHSLYSNSDGEIAFHFESNLKESLREDEELSSETALEKMNFVFDKEKHFRNSTLGPHRDDFCILFDNSDARAFASQGQARSIVLSLKLGVIDLLRFSRKESPIILLDDVESELDAERRDRFIHLLLEHDCQVFISGTECREQEQYQAKGLRLYEVSNGSVSRPLS